MFLDLPKLNYFWHYYVAINRGGKFEKEA